MQRVMASEQGSAALSRQCTAMVHDRATGRMRRCLRHATKGDPQQRCAAHAAQCDSMYREYKSYCKGMHAENDLPSAPCRPLHARQDVGDYVRSVQRQLSANRGCEARIRAFDSTCMAAHADFDPRAEGSRGHGHEKRLRELQRDTERCEGLLANAMLQRQRHEERLAARRLRGLVAAAARERGEDVARALTPVGVLDAAEAAAEARAALAGAAGAGAGAGGAGHALADAAAAAAHGEDQDQGRGGGGVTPQRLRQRGIVAVMHRPRPEPELIGQQKLNRTPERRPSLAELFGQFRVPGHRYDRKGTTPVRVLTNPKKLFLEEEEQ